MTKTRRLFWLSVLGIAVPLFSFCLLHTPPFRREALARLASYLERSQGIALHARSFDYNLLSASFLLEGVSLRNSDTDALPAFLTAARVRLRFRYRDLIRGDLKARSVQAEGLRLDVVIKKDGTSNVDRTVPATSSRGQLRLPVDVFEINGLFLSLNDEGSGFRAQLPAGTAKGFIDRSRGDQEVEYALQEPGRVRWNGRGIPVENLTLNLGIQDHAIMLRNMHIGGKGFGIEASGTLQDPESPRLNVVAHADVEGTSISPWIDLKEPLSGRVQAAITVSGSLNRPSITAELRSNALKIGAFQWDSVAAQGRFESSTGILHLADLVAKMYGGQIRAAGQLSLTGQGQSTVNIEGSGLDLRRTCATLGWRAPPRGEASGRITISFPGNRWDEAKISTGISVAISPAAGIRPVPSITAQLTGQLSGKRIRVAIESISGYGASLRGSAEVGTPDQSLTGELRGTVGNLARLIRGLEGNLGKPAGSLMPFPVDGRAEWRTALTGSLREPRASVDLEATALSAGGVADASLQLHGDYGSDRFLITRARLDWHGQSATAEGEIGLASPSSPVRLEALAEGLSLGEILLGLKLGVDVHGTASAKISAAGTRSNPRVNARIEAHGIEAYGEPVGSLSAEAEWNGPTLVLHRLQLDNRRQSGNGTLEARGRANFDSREYELSLAAENLRPLYRLKGIPMTGTVRLNADGKGTFDNPTLHVEAECKDLRVADEDLGLLHAVLQVSDHCARLNVENAALGLAAGAEIMTEGALPFHFDVTASSLPYHFTAAGQRAAAVISGAFLQGKGSLRPAEIQEASATLKNVQVESGEKKIRGEGPVEIRYAGRRFYLQPVTLVSGEIRLQAHGELPLENGGEPGKLSLTGDIDLDSMARLFSVEQTINAGGRARLDGEVRGSWISPTASATLTLAGATLRSQALPGTLEDLNATVRLDERRISVDSLSAKVGQGTIRGSVSLTSQFLSPEAAQHAPEEPARFSIAADKVSFNSRDGTTVGLFSGTVSGESPLRSIEGTIARLELTEFSLSRDSFSIRQAEPATLTIRDGRVHVDRWRWTSPSGELQLAGTVGITGEYPLDFHISGAADAAICSLLDPSAFGKGSLKMDLRALGTPADPLLSGVLEMQKATVGIRQPRLLVEDLDLKIELDRGRFHIRTLNGVLNGGRIQGSGNASFHQRKLTALEVDLTGQNIFLEYPPRVRSSSSLHLRASGDDSEILIAGEVGIREGSYVEPFDFSARSTADLIGKVESRNRTQELGANVRYDIRVRTVQPFEIDNNLARLSARADMRLVGDPASPGMLGTLTLDRGGKLYFGGRVYYTERGVVSFANPTRIDPVYDLVATTQVSDYQVALRLSGTGSEIAATFTSDPPLSQNDIVALLLTGKPQSESGGGRVDPAQAERLSVLSGVLNADLSARMRRRFGISQVMIQPSLISGEYDPGARLTIGQDLSQSLRFVYSMNLVNSADQVWYTQYDFGRRFTSRVTMQSDNSYRTDFQQDFSFGGRKAGLSELSARSGKLEVGTVEFSGTPVFDSTALGRQFKIASGSTFNFVKSRRGIERLQKFYAKGGYLGARIYMDRSDQDRRVNLLVQIEAGKKVKIQYAGAQVPKSVDKRVRKLWQEGITDRQRAADAERMLSEHLFKKGYPRATVAANIAELPPDENHVCFNIDTGLRYRRVLTVFEGAAPEHAASIALRLKQRNIADKVGSRPEAVVDAVTSYYREKGYHLAKVAMPRLEPDKGRDTASMVLRVVEGPPIKIRTLDFQGNEAVTAAELKKDLPLREGSTLNQDQLKKTIAAIAEKYGENGYRSLEVAPRTLLDETKGLADLTFVIKEGVRSIIQSVTIQGEDRVSDEYIRRQLRMAEGQPQDVPQTNQSIRNLYNTGAFARVDVESVPSKSPPASGAETEKVDVLVSIREVAPYKFLYGGYYDSGRGPGGVADVESRNLLGAARVLGVRMRYDASLQEGRVYYSQPLWRGRARPTTATVFYRREADYYEGLSAERAGFTLQQEAKLGKKLVASYGYRFETVHSWYPDKQAPNPPRAIVSPLTLSLTRNTRDDFLDPSSGSFTSIAMELGPKALGSTYGYTRFFSQYFKYFPLRKSGRAPFQEEVKKPRLIFATGIRVGLIKGLTNDQVIPTERFYAGGGTTVRGFRQDTLGPLDQYGDPMGGNAMMVLNNELRFPMFSIFDAVGFVDVGNVFPQVSDFRFSELRRTAGFGLRLRTPSLMLRFDYGFKLGRRPGESPGAFFFSIGQAF